MPNSGNRQRIFGHGKHDVLELHVSDADRRADVVAFPFRKSQTKKG
jgi:hypothetical protein